MSARRELAVVGAALLCCLAAGVPPALAGDSTRGADISTTPETLPAPDALSPAIFEPRSQTVPPLGFSVSARQAVQIGERTRTVKRARAAHPALEGSAYISPLPLAVGTFYHWDVFYRDHGRDIAEVEIGPEGRVYDVQTAPDVGWTLLRGYPGVLGGILNSPYIWLPLCVLFLLPFLDFRRPFRLLHLDLAMLLAFGVSHYFFNLGRPGISVPLVYPFLVYVAARMAFMGFRPRRREGPLIPYASTGFLATGLVILVVLRILFGMFGSHTLDVSAAGVIGADRITHGLPLYVDNSAHGDTYGPVNYLMYVPAEQLVPYTFFGGFMRTARIATLMFDVLTIGALFLLGRRLRAGPAGTRLGTALAYGWAAYPYSALVIGSNTNDALVPLFIVLALLVMTSPPARGMFAALASLTKWVPLIVTPMLLVGRGPARRREMLIATAAFTATCIVLIAPFFPAGGIRELWNTTIGFQLSRTSPLSIWIREPGLDWLRALTQAIAIGLALVATFYPRRRTVGQIAALCAAVFAAVQIPAAYWLYFYLAWFAPLVLIAAFEEHPDLGPAGSESQGRVMRALLKPVKISRPDSVTTTRSSILTPSSPGR